ncbi:hypothetical protein AB0L25_34400 [Spirillospora sp. NPDC052242]
MRGRTNRPAAPAAATRPATTAAFAAGTSPRRGAAASVGTIVRVPYSPPIAGTFRASRRHHQVRAERHHLAGGSTLRPA